jgi:manganese transport system permease protein
MLVIAPTLSALCSLTGIYLSYWVDASPGGLVVVTQGCAFALVLLLGPRHGLLGTRVAARLRRPGSGSAAEDQAGAAAS